MDTPFVGTEACATKVMNIAITFMYQAGFWIESRKARRLSDFLYTFLSKYAQCAQLCLQQRLRRFSILPKGHMIAHEAFRLRVESQRAPWVINTIAYTNQVQENFIGRPSRLSRRVNIKNLHWNTLLRTLILYQQSFVENAFDLRGLDAYGDL